MMWLYLANGEAAMQRPYLVVVSEDAQRLESLAGDLMRRYEPDHHVVSSASVSDALVRLAGLGQAGADVAPGDR
jgi:hypothetical protein